MNDVNCLKNYYVKQKHTMSYNKPTIVKLKLADGLTALSFGLEGILLQGRLLADDHGVLEAAKMVMSNEKWLSVGSFDVTTGEISWHRSKVSGEDLLIDIANPVETHPNILTALVASREFQATVEGLFKLKVIKIVVE